MKNLLLKICPANAKQENQSAQIKPKSISKISKRVAMLYNKPINLLNYNERNLFSVDSKGEIDFEPSEEFLVFEGRKILLKSKIKGRGFRLGISLLKKTKTQHLASKIKIMLSHPKNARHEDIMEFLQKHNKWIAKICANYEKEILDSNQIIESHNDEVLLFGEWVSKETLLQRAQTCERIYTICKGLASRDRVSPYSINSTLENPSKPPKKPKKPMTTKQLLTQQLLFYVACRTKEIAEQMGLEYGKIIIRDTVSRFGSCTENRLSFSLLLVCAKKEQIDYVIIHELSHIVHKNHSSRFWNLVATYCPQWNELRKSLKQDYALFRNFLQAIE